jgi:hypothetical protein
MVTQLIFRGKDVKIGLGNARQLKEVAEKKNVETAELDPLFG